MRFKFICLLLFMASHHVKAMDRCQAVFDSRRNSIAQVEVASGPNGLQYTARGFELKIRDLKIDVPEVIYIPKGYDSNFAADVLNLPRPKYKMAGVHREVFIEGEHAIKIYKDIDRPPQTARKIQRELILQAFLELKGIPIAKVISVLPEGIIIQEAKGPAANVLLKERYSKFGPSWEHFLRRIKELETDPDYLELASFLRNYYGYGGIDFTAENVSAVWDKEARDFKTENGYISFVLIDW